jgi:hypothetical protein
VLIRQSAPVLGASASPYLQPGEFQVSASMRRLRSDTHFKGVERQIQREIDGSYVVNMQRLFDLGVTWQATRRLNLSASVPFIDASWTLPYPVRPPGTRVPQVGRGLGDIVAVARYWVLDTRSHLTQNISAGVGVKLPTGHSSAASVYPDLTGQNPTLKAVDQSVQPGDGGWGVLFEGQYFRRVKAGIVFGSATYLANPGDTNATPSILVGLGRGATAGSRYFNSVPDQYLVRVGGAVPVPSVKGLSVSGALRMEGLKRYDLFGRSDGFRRPGFELFLEPGIAYSRGRQSLSFNFPIGIHANRLPDPYTGAAGDATFPGYIALANYSIRFGRPGGRPTLPTGPTPVTQ